MGRGRSLVGHAPERSRKGLFLSLIERGIQVLKVRCSNQLSYSPETLSYRRPARQQPGRFAAVKPTKQA